MTYDPNIPLPAFDPAALQKTGHLARLGEWASDQFRLAYLPLRLLPILRVGSTVFVARRDDVEEVLANTDAFHVRSGVRLAELRTAANIAPIPRTGLGEDALATHNDATKTLTQALRLQDTAATAGIVLAYVNDRLNRANGNEDIGDLLLMATADFARQYFGLVQDVDLRPLALCCHALVGYAFGRDKPASPAGRVGRDAAARVSAIVLKSIAAQKRAPDTATIIGRLLSAKVPDDVIESLIVVSMMAQVTVPAAASMQALRFLLRRPAVMWTARAAALDDDDAALGRCLMEALRFNYIAPAQLRDCKFSDPKKGVIAAGTWRQKCTRNGDTVAALLPSAMFDGRRVPAPRTFNPDRDSADNLIFGFGMHRCAGFALGRVLLVQLLKPLLQRGVRQAARERRRIAYFGAFPEAFPVQIG